MSDAAVDCAVTARADHLGLDLMGPPMISVLPETERLEMVLVISAVLGVSAWG